MTCRRIATTLTLCLATLLLLVLSGCDSSNSPAANPTDATPASNTPVTPAPVVTPDEARPSAPTGTGPILTLEKTVHNFGLIADGRVRRCTFPFTNTGTETLVIESLKASCGCTATSLSKTEFAPGEGAEIEVSFEPKGTGDQSKNIAIVSNSSQNSLVHVYLRANIQPVITVDSIYLRYETVALGQEHLRSVIVSSAFPTLEIAAVSTPNAYTSMANMERISDNQFRITFQLHSNLRWGGFYSTAMIQAETIVPETGRKLEHPITIHLSASVFGQVHASDTMFRVERVRPGGTFQKIIRLTNPGGQPFRVLSAVLERPSFPGMTLESREITQPGQAGYELILRGNAGSYLGPVNGVVRIFTDARGEENIFIPIAGIVRQ